MGYRVLIAALVTVVVAALAIQFVPYGHGHTNPPGRGEPAWDAPQTRALAVRACFDCHSHETTWPWYSDIAPVSWLIQRDVEEGRKAVNYSDWNHRRGEEEESAETVRSGEMPPWYYTMIQSKARLTDAERAALIRGLELTFGGKGRKELRHD